MKTRATSWSLLVLMFSTGLASADQQPGNPIQSQLFSPELLMQHREELGLTEQQLTRIHGHLEQLKADGTEVHKKLEAATGKLGDLLGKEVVDESAVLKQFDEVLNAEREVKRLHLQVMIRVKNELTAKQQRLLAEKVKQAAGMDELRDRLHAKMARIQKEVERRAGAGEPPTEAMEVMQTFPEHMKSGRHKEAEAVLDRVLKMLGVEEEKKGPEKKATDKKGPTKESPASGASKPPPARSTAAPPLSAKQVRAEIDSLRKADVAWRKVSWKTCLVEGLNASAQQHKPALLWIFIDRPIDDERC